MTRRIDMRVLFTTVTLAISINSLSQIMNFPSGSVTRAELEMKGYPNDTSASAVVLNEMGQAYISERAEEDLIFDYYVKVKILKKDGLKQGDFSIGLGKSKNGSAYESLLSVSASTFNRENGVTKESKMSPKSVFTRDSKFGKIVTFTLPDVREGSVLEVKFQMNSPFLGNFHTWEFQDEIPKVHSEFWAIIPANYIYNIALRGFLKLTKNESSALSACFGGGRADCALLKYAIDNVPAFLEEDNMTASSNFISAVYFELAEIRGFDGRIDKRTVEWKDADQELRQDEDFGSQIKKARNLFEDKIASVIGPETDELKKARLIFDFIKKKFLWNDTYGIHTEVGVKKAFEVGKGNVADINLSLVGALQAAGLDASPVILSTRANGLPIELHPVISEFNYVIAAVKAGGTQYLLDATNSKHPFGLLPLYCINGKGRLMEKESSWIPLKPSVKSKTATTLSLTMSKDGGFEGNVSTSYYGYHAVAKRKEIASAGEKSENQKRLQDKFKEIEIKDYQIENLDSLDKPLIEKIEIKLVSSDAGNPSMIYFSPFIWEKVVENPFKSTERLYPVDFGAPYERVMTLSLINESPYEVDELPSPIALTLPGGGGRYLFNVSKFDKRITLTSSLNINKPVYNSGEYPGIKELFSRIVQANQSQIVFKKN